MFSTVAPLFMIFIQRHLFSDCLHSSYILEVETSIQRMLLLTSVQIRNAFREIMAFVCGIFPNRDFLVLVSLPLGFHVSFLLASDTIIYFPWMDINRKSLEATGKIGNLILSIGTLINLSCYARII